MEETTEPQICPGCYLVFESMKALKEHLLSCPESKSSTFVNEEANQSRSLHEDDYTEMETGTEESHADQEQRIVASTLLSEPNECKPEEPPGEHEDENEHKETPAEKVDEELLLKVDQGQNNAEKKPFACKICHLTHEDLESLNKYNESNQNSPLLACANCSTVFSEKKAMDQHKCMVKPSDANQKVEKEKNLTKRFQCDRCEKNFLLKCDLVRHMTIHTGVKPHQCDLCEKRFILEINLITHKCITYTCAVCGNSLANRPNLKRHMRIHAKSKKKTYKCDDCEECFTEETSLKQHVMTHSGKKPHKCDQCEKEFEQESQLEQHKLTHLPDGIEPHKCDLCKEAFATKWRLEKHSKEVHFGSNPNKCHFCPKMLANKYIAKRHMLICANRKPKSLACNLCNEAFVSKRSLISHKIKRHASGPHKCYLCGESFGSEAMAKRHRQLHAREHKCEECGYAFKEACGLRRHMVVHTGEKPFKCDICGKAFALKFKLKEHLGRHAKSGPILRNMSSINKILRGQKPLNENSEADKDKPYKCVFCSQSFNRERNLDRHILWHPGSERHRCKTCGKVFGLMSSLETHRSKVHWQLQAFEQPAETQPVGAQPVGAQLVGTQPVGVQPMGTQLIGAQPVGVQLVNKQPVGVQPMCTPSNVPVVVNVPGIGTIITGYSIQPFQSIPTPLTVINTVPAPAPLTTINPVPASLTTINPVPTPLRTINPVPGPLTTINPGPTTVNVPAPLTTINPGPATVNVPAPLITINPGPSPNSAPAPGTSYSSQHAGNFGLEPLNTHSETHQDRPLPCDEVPLKIEKSKNEHVETDADVAVKSNAAEGTYLTEFSDDNEKPVAPVTSTLVSEQGEKNQEENQDNQHKDEKTITETPTEEKVHIHEDHLEQNNIDKKPFLCNICHLTFKDVETLNKHNESHQNTPLYVCSSCKAVFAEMKALDEHKCMSKPSKLDQEPAKRKMNVGKHQCPICKKFFCKRSYVLDFHMLTHTRAQVYKCKFCNKDFAEESLLSAHQLGGSCKGNKSFECGVCGQTFGFKINLDHHMLTHTGEKPYQCDECHRSFTHPLSLKKHKATHSDARHFQCDRCVKRFSTIGRLRNHMRTHIGENPHKCDQCERTFKENKHLLMHLKTHAAKPHSEKKLFKCEHCEREFPYRSLRNQHMLMHSSEKPHHCDKCDSVFTYKPNLVRHMKTQH